MKKVSLVILTRDRRQELLECVERALALPEAPAVIVVDNASSDGTGGELKARYPHVKLVRAPFDMGAAARNLGAECADTAYVAFCDADADWAPGSLRLAELVLDMYPRVGALAARVLVGIDGREDPASAILSRSPLPSPGLPGPAVLSFLPAATIFRRRAFLEAGGYEPRFFAGGEEHLLGLDLAAAGWRMVFMPSLVVHRFPPLRGPQVASDLMRARNALWLAWLRRPLDVALARTLEHLSGRRDFRALLEALRQVGWALRNRRVLPAQVERWCRLVEEQRVEPPLPAWESPATTVRGPAAIRHRRQVS